MKRDTASGIVGRIKSTYGRLDIVVNNAGLNIAGRSWPQLKPEGVDELIHGNLSSALYCVTAALPLMRAQRDGLFIHTSSMAGRLISPLSGSGYTASKHGVVAMSHSLNMEGRVRKWHSLHGCMSRRSCNPDP